MRVRSPLSLVQAIRCDNGGGPPSAALPEDQGPAGRGLPAGARIPIRACGPLMPFVAERLAGGQGDRFTSERPSYSCHHGLDHRRPDHRVQCLQHGSEPVVQSTATPRGKARPAGAGGGADGMQTAAGASQPSEPMGSDLPAGRHMSAER